MPTTIDKVKDQLKAAGVGKLVLWSAGRDLFPLAQALGEGEEIRSAVRGEMDGKAIHTNVYPYIITNNTLPYQLYCSHASSKPLKTPTPLNDPPK